MSNIDRRGAEHIVWTCLACGFVNAWNWDEPDYVGSVKITMTCDSCERKTEMKLLKEAAS